MKKVILIILIVLLVAAGATGTIYFYIQNKNQIEQNTMLAQRNSQVQAQLDTIGTMTTAYEVVSKVYSGNAIKDSDLIEVSVPASTVFESSITDRSQLVGRCYRVDVNPGTILSKDMLMDIDEDGDMKFTREITFTSMPVSTKVGDYVDVRIILPNGEEYVIFNHKQIKRMFNNQTITIEISEEEHVILNAAIQDCGNYAGFCMIYLMKYLEPGNDNSIAYYPIQHEMENYVKFNPNIKDTTRCINPTLRDHIDEVFLVYTDSANQQMASSFIATLQTQYTAQLAMQQDWISINTDDEGNFSTENDTYGEGGSGSVNFDQEVGNAMDSLENSFQDLEAIQ